MLVMMTSLHGLLTFLLILLVVTAGVGLFVEFRDGYFDAQDLAWLALMRTQTAGDVVSQPSLLHPEGGPYQPLADLLVWVQGAACNGNPLPTVIVIIAAHLLCVLLLFLVARPALGSAAASLAALIFAWHPLVSGLFCPLVEGVQWAFALLFLLTGLWGYSLARQGRRMIGLTLGACAMLCASAMGPWYTLPLVIFLYDLGIPRKRQEPAWAKRILYQIPLWVGIALPIVVGLTWIEFPEVPDSGTVNLEWTLFEFDSNRIAKTHLLFDPMADLEDGKSNSEFPFGGLIFALISGTGLIMGGIRYRSPFFLKLLLCLFLYGAMAHIGLNGTSPAPVAKDYPANAFLCLFTGLMASCLFTRKANDPPPIPSSARAFAPSRLSLLALIPLVGLPAASGWTIHTISSDVKQPGIWIRDCRDQVLEMLEPGRSIKEPVFLLNTPAHVLPVAESKEDPLPLRSLGFAFNHPFVEESVRLFPLHDAPYLSHELLIPFMLHLYGDGQVLIFDEASGRIRSPNVDEVGRQYLLEYGTRFCQGLRPSPINLQQPVKKMSLPIDRETGFTVIFPLRKAQAERVVLLTRYGPTEILFDDLDFDMVNYQGNKPFFNLQVMDELIGRTLIFFPGESAFMWVESINDKGDVFHRSDLIWFYLK